MSRHRNIRSMNYSEEYDGYDDVYGHSVEDDYCMSPSQAAFMYNRDNSQRIGAFIQSQNDIAEEEEDDEMASTDKAKLESCIDVMKATLGTHTTRQQMVEAAVHHNYDSEKAINEMLDKQMTTTTPVFAPVSVIEKEKDKKDLTNLTKSIGGFSIPKFSSKAPFYAGLNKKINLSAKSSQEPLADKEKAFNSLFALTSSHLGVGPIKTISCNKFSSKKAKDNMDTDKENEILQLTDQLDDIKISKNKSETDWCLNLTNSLLNDNKTSLRYTKSACKIDTIEKEEIFVPQFINASENCRTDVKPRLSCSYDVKNTFLQRVCKHTKKASKFGRVFCRSYTKFVPFLPSYPRTTVRQFAFTTLSPDDLISRHLRRK